MYSWFRNNLSIWVFIGAVVLALIFIGGLWTMLFLLKPQQVGSKQPTAIFTIIPPEITTPNPEFSMDIYPTQDSSSEKQNDIAIGKYVEVSGTGSSGLRVRSGDGINHFVQFIAFDNELYEVQAGPQEADGYIWWFIVSAYDQKRSGWVVENYIKVVSPQ